MAPFSFATLPLPASVGFVDESSQERIQELFDAALAVQRNAYAPYSNYRVGAAILTADGRIFAGCNVENAAYPQGACAEVGAIAAMCAAGEREIVAVLTVCDGDTLGTCCGGCRQRIREFAGPEVLVHSVAVSGATWSTTVAALLPHSFGPEFLDRE